MNIVELYLSGQSIPEISVITGICRSTIRNILFKENVLRDRTAAVRLAAEKGKLGSGLRGKKREFTQEWKDNISKSKIGKGAGVSKKKSGYIEITAGKNKSRMQHVVIIEEMIGRRLYANECVHHKNGIRCDNRPENLQLMTRSDHSSIHAKESVHKRERDKGGKFI